MSDNNSPLSKMKAEVFQATAQKDISLSVSKEQNLNEDSKEYLSFLYNGSQINSKYHENSIKLAENVIRISMAIFVIVTVFTCFIIGYSVMKSNLEAAKTIIPLVSSAFIDSLSAILIRIMKGLIQSKDKFFEESIKSEETSKIIGLVKTMKDGKSKNEMIAELVSNYCNNQKKSNE